MYRINELIKTGKNVFSIKDIGFIWKIKNKNTLYTTLKRYVKKGLIFRIRKGVYSLKPKKHLSFLEIASALIGDYHYLTTETILQKEGLIFQSSNQLTFVSKKNFKIKFDDYLIRVRKLKSDYLFNLTGIRKEAFTLVADKERAIADILYFNKKFHFDNKDINWKKVKHYQKLIGFK